MAFDLSIFNSPVLSVGVPFKSFYAVSAISVFAVHARSCCGIFVIIHLFKVRGAKAEVFCC